MKKRFFCCAIATLAMTYQATAQSAQRTMTINELFNLVEDGSIALKVEKSGVDVAKRGVEEARSKRLPDINTSLQASYSGNVLMTDRNLRNAKSFSQPHWGNSFALEAQQVVYSGGAITAGIKMAELQHQLSQNNVNMQRNQQRFVALGQFLDLLKLDNGIKVYDSNISLTQKLIENIKAKQAQGMALKNDVTRYELQLQQLLLGKRKLIDQKAIANHQLCNTLGLENTEITPEVDLNIIGNEGAQESDVQNDVITHSPMLRQSELGIQIADQQLKLAKSEMLPKVAIVAADQFSGPFNMDIPPIDKNFNIWYVGIGVKYSLSSLFKSNKGVSKAKEAVRQSQEAHTLSGQIVNNSVQEAVTLHKQAFVNLRTQQKSVELASQNYRVINDRYINQLALITDMVDASNIKLNAELEEVNAKINIAYTYYRMLYASGKLQ